MKKGTFKFNILFQFLLLVSIGGCSSTGPQRELQIFVKPTRTLTSENRIAVPVPADGEFQNKVYAGSGEKTNEATLQVFKNFLNDAERIQCAPSECLRVASDANFEYLAQVEIIHWEDRNSSWSGRRDRLILEFNLIEIQGRKIIAAAILTGEGTLNTLGGEHVEDELLSTIKPFVSLLFGE